MKFQPDPTLGGSQLSQNAECALHKFLDRAFLLLILAIINAAAVFSQEPSFQISPIFADNMVLQQGRKVPIWGKGVPGTQVVVHTSWGRKAEGTVQADSSWSATVQTPRTGGPYEISITHKDTTLVLRNVLVGEVWLCSGQSNMEMPLEGWPPRDTISNAAAEIAGARYAAIRFFTVKHAYSTHPESSFKGSWVACSPETAPRFSATAYFFGKMLHKTLKVPIGLIQATWGGTVIESWMSAGALSQIEEQKATLRLIEQSNDSLQALNAWLLRHPMVDVLERDPNHKWENLHFNDSVCSARDFNDSAWHQMKLPTVWEKTSLGNFDGAVWFRKRVVIPAEWIGKELTLQLGPVDDMDETFVNGKLVGSHLGEGFWQVDRSYPVPAALVQDTSLQIAVRVIDYQGGGGIFGEEGKLQLRLPDQDSRVPLEGEWKYLPVAEYRGNTFYVFGAEAMEFFSRPQLPIDFSGYSPTALFNGMIAPLAPFGMKGVIWYQGESNTPDPIAYRTLFPLMINDWRSAFQSGDFPFYFVQIAPYNYDSTSQSQYLREAQFQTLAVKNTGMAVTLDIGDAKNIHPANKQDVAKRLALWALAKTYNRKVSFSGPLYRSMKIEKDHIILSFDQAGKRLVLRERPTGNGFQIAGADRQFKEAQVTVRGTKLVVSHPEIRDPVAVRYAFSNAAEATLFSSEGLPSSSFRTDDWTH